MGEGRFSNGSKWGKGIGRMNKRAQAELFNESRDKVIPKVPPALML